MSNTYGPYSLGVWIHDTLPPPAITGIRDRAGQEIGVRVGQEPAIDRRPGETTYQLCQRAAAQHGTERPYVLLYA